MNPEKDRLLTVVERIYSDLRSKAQAQKLSLDGNMLIKFARYYLRHQADKNALEKLFKLMQQEPEKRGKQFIGNWHLIRETLKSKESTLKNLSPDDAGYVLGWIAKLARANVIM